MERGFSLFLGNSGYRTDQTQYIRRMSEARFTFVFTSLHIPEEDAALYVERLDQLVREAHRCGLRVIVDVSPSSLPYVTSLDESVDGLRLDYGFSAEAIMELAKTYQIAFNASTLTETFLHELVNQGLSLKNVEAWHNYYPRPETGLSLEWIKRRNQWLHTQGLKTVAFVSGDGQKRGPLYRGLPTAEAHREVSPYGAARDLHDQLHTDAIVIGDQDLSPYSLMTFRENEARLRVTVREDIQEAELALLQLPHRQRFDPARDVIRSETSRPYARKGEFAIRAKETQTPSSRLKGTVTIDNETYGRYEGELQIMKKELPFDEKVNVVANVREEDMILLDILRPGEPFRLVTDE